MEAESTEATARKKCDSQEVFARWSHWPMDLSFLAMLVDGRALNGPNKPQRRASPPLETDFLRNRFGCPDEIEQDDVLNVPAC
jgi:hypothetical protein